jgi:hypothetical protein
MPNWMSGNAMPSAPPEGEQPKEAGSPQTAAADRHAAQPAAHQTQESVNLAPPLNPTPAAPAFNYPSTGAAGLNSPTPAAPPTAQTPYPTTGYGAGPGSYGAPSSGPAARTGMRDPGPPPAYPTTGALQGPFPSDVTPPAMSPRYERIR